MSKIWIDPPSGWRYGFPAVFDTASGQRLDDWLVTRGYPYEEVEFAMQYLRMWDWDPKLDSPQVDQ